MSSRFARAAGISTIFTLFGSSLHFGFGVLATIATGGNAGKFLIDTLAGSILLWVVLTAICYEIAGAFDELNKRGRADSDANRDRTSDTDGSPASASSDLTNGGGLPPDRD